MAEASDLEVFSGAELRQLIGASRQVGEVRKQEHDMLGAVFDLEKLEVGEVMTHRRNIVSINADAPVEEIVRQVLEGPYTRYPIWRGDPDTITGVLHAKDVLAAVQRLGAELTGADLRRLAAPPWFIPDTTSLLHQLLAFRQRRAHLAFVVDEYGALMGLVTLEDILEEIVGDIVDEKDVEMSGVQQEADGSILVEGRVTIRDLNRQFDWNLPDDEATTVAGLLIYEARRIPEVGESSCSTASASRWCAGSGTSSPCCACAPKPGWATPPEPASASAASKKIDATMERTGTPARLRGGAIPLFPAVTGRPTREGGRLFLRGGRGQRVFPGSLRRVPRGARPIRPVHG